MLKTAAFLIMCLAALTVAAQTATVEGKVVDMEGAPLPFAYVGIDSLKLYATADKEGHYLLQNVPQGTCTLTATITGYQKQTQTLNVNAKVVTALIFKLEINAKGLNEVVIDGQRITQADKVREQAYAITSIDVKALQSLNLDVNSVLNRTTGIRIRQEGGLGSDFSFSLNGFSGNQVRFFIDGLPVNYLGASLTFNNIPVNIVERLEVYKGVVPVSLGADALGGAVNVVTSNTAKSFLDVSYSYGSFNTHQAAVVSRVTLKKGVIINASGFFNYSDNSYTIDASLIDKTTGKIGEPQPVKRFNDGYLSASAMVEAGVVNKRFADHFLIGFIGSGNRKEIQQGANMTKVSGQVFRTDKSFTPTLKYLKNNLFTENLTLKVAAIYSYNQSLTVDTSSRVYDWDGSYTTKGINVISGELNWDKTLFRFNDHAALVNATLEYTLGRHHTFTLNNTYSWFQRKGEDPISYNAVPFGNPNVLSKNITGLAYKLSLFKNRWNTTVFVKAFNMNARVYAENAAGTGYDSKKTHALQHGEGIASTVFITPYLQAKVSYEYTCRMPESYEMFGDGLLLLPNPDLTPEKSHNLNAGLLFGKKFGSHLLNAEAGFVYRRPQNMVRLVAIAITSQYQNLASAGITGYEASVRYSYKQWISLELNATYQDLRNTNKTNNNYPDPLYKDRIPNVPYLFGNALVSFKSIALSKYKLQVGVDWSTMYVEQFYLKWPSQGAQDDKLVIPRQLSHDASLTLSGNSGMYNISFTCANLLNARRYDNFKVQKPGRSFNVKVRFYLTQFGKKHSPAIN